MVLPKPGDNPKKVVSNNAQGKGNLDSDPTDSSVSIMNRKIRNLSSMCVGTVYTTHQALFAFFVDRHVANEKRCGYLQINIVCMWLAFQ